MDRTRGVPGDLPEGAHEVRAPSRAQALGRYRERPFERPPDVMRVVEGEELFEEWLTVGRMELRGQESGRETFVARERLRAAMHSLFILILQCRLQCTLSPLFPLPQ